MRNKLLRVIKKITDIDNLIGERLMRNVKGVMAGIILLVLVAISAPIFIQPYVGPNNGKHTIPFKSYFLRVGPRNGVRHCSLDHSGSITC